MAGAAGAAVAACSEQTAGSKAAGTTASRTPRASVPIAENARPGDPHWAIRHLGAEHEIEGYAGRVSVRQGESFPLFVSSTSPGYRVTAYRLGWYQGDGARHVWQSGPLRGHRQNGPVLAGRRTRSGRTGTPRWTYRPTTGRRARTCSGWTRIRGDSATCR